MLRFAGEATVKGFVGSGGMIIGLAQVGLSIKELVDGINTDRDIIRPSIDLAAATFFTGASVAMMVPGGQPIALALGIIGAVISIGNIIASFFISQGVNADFRINYGRHFDTISFTPDTRQKHHSATTMHSATVGRHTSTTQRHASTNQRHVSTARLGHGGRGRMAG